MMLSRVADSLYWMSRYLERAEHIARLLGMLHETLLESDIPDGDASWLRVLASPDASPPGSATEAGAGGTGPSMEMFPYCSGNSSRRNRTL